MGVSPGTARPFQYSEPPKWGDIIKPGAVTPRGPQPRAVPPFQGLDIFPQHDYLGLTPQAVRFHRFAVGKAGSRSRVLADLPAQQEEGAPTNQGDAFKINFSRRQGEAGATKTWA